MAHQDRAAIQEFVDACHGTDVETLWYATVGLSDQGVSALAWRYAMEAIARTQPRIAPELQHWFSIFWVSMPIAACVDDDDVLRAALRVLLPPYHGPAVRLYRGASASERRPYGLSWSLDPACALQHAENHTKTTGKISVVLETMALPGAIISAVSELTNTRPRAREREYIVDGNRLDEVACISSFFLSYTDCRSQRAMTTTPSLPKSSALTKVRPRPTRTPGGQYR
jgi:hypothetical protein